MQITGVTAYHLPGTRYPWVFLRIDTDAGIHGIGQVSSGPNSTVVAAAASRLGPLLIGEDPSRIDYLWHKLFSGFNSLGSLGFVSALISGVDIALWDIRGKELDLPIYELLGGRFHDRLILYSNGWFAGCTTPNFFRLEIAYSELPMYQEALTPPLDVHDGYYHVSDRPGLGHDLREDYLSRAIPY